MSNFLVIFKFYAAIMRSKYEELKMGGSAELNRNPNLVKGELKRATEQFSP